MSLRSFHVVFILASLSLFAFTGWWAGQRLAVGLGGVFTLLAAASAFGLAAGVPYLAWFLRKGPAR